jgi:hypothetical protein
VPEVVRTAAGTPVARPAPSAKNPADRSSTIVVVSTPGSRNSARASGLDRDPGQIAARRTPHRASSSTMADASAVLRLVGSTRGRTLSVHGGLAGVAQAYCGWMTARRATMIGSSAAATAVALALVASGGPETAVPSEAAASATARVEIKESRKVAVENCSTRSEARFPGAFTKRRNLVVGPLAMYGAGKRRVHYFPGFASDAGGQKFQLLVRNGHRVSVELSRRARRDAGLAYGPLRGGEVGLADANRVVTFIACGRGDASGSRADGRPVTFWSGGVLASSPRCVPLRVFVDGASAAHRAVIHLGVRHCR